MAGVVWSESIVVLLKHAYKGTDYNLAVKEKTPVFHVPDVMFDAALHLPQLVGLSAIASHLGPAGDARFDEVAHHVFSSRRL